MKPDQLAVMHWGTYLVTTDNGKLTAISSVAVVHWAIAARRGTGDITRLSSGGARRVSERGREPFVEVSWELALALVADELTRVKCERGNAAIYGDSYGWSSAGLFPRRGASLLSWVASFFSPSEASFSGEGYRWSRSSTAG